MPLTTGMASLGGKQALMGLRRVAPSYSIKLMEQTRITTPEHLPKYGSHHV